MNRDYSLFIKDIFQAINDIESFVGISDFNAFSSLQNKNIPPLSPFDKGELSDAVTSAPERLTLRRGLTSQKTNTILYQTGKHEPASIDLSTRTACAFCAGCAA